MSLVRRLKRKEQTGAKGKVHSHRDPRSTRCPRAAAGRSPVSLRLLHPPPLCLLGIHQVQPANAPGEHFCCAAWEG